jgi:fatty acid desaturase
MIFKSPDADSPNADAARAFVAASADEAAEGGPANGSPAPNPRRATSSAAFPAALADADADADPDAESDPALFTDEADIAAELTRDKATTLAMLAEARGEASLPAPNAGPNAADSAEAANDADTHASAFARTRRGRTRATDLLTRDEIARFMQRSNAKAAAMVAFNWALIAAILAVPALWPNPLTILLAIVLLGGRLLGLGVMMHDCGHRAMFAHPGLNDFVGQWLCAGPILSNLDGYRNNHAQHHVLAGSDKDPDLPNYRNYAVSKASFRRKILRDLTGRTGIRQMLFLFRVLWFKRLVGPVIVNALMFAACWAAGSPWVYALWPLAYITTYMLYSRIRNAAEHAVVPDLYSPDPLQHTRTTYARWWERLTVAPNKVNYHLEHHLLPTVPPYNLKALHETLKAKGVYTEADIAPNYTDVIRRLTTA